MFWQLCFFEKIHVYFSQSLCLGRNCWMGGWLQWMLFLETWNAVQDQNVGNEPITQGLQNYGMWRLSPCYIHLFLKVCTNNFNDQMKLRPMNCLDIQNSRKLTSKHFFIISSVQDSLVFDWQTSLFSSSLWYNLLIFDSFVSRMWLNNWQDVLQY